MTELHTDRRLASACHDFIGYLCDRRQRLVTMNVHSGASPVERRDNLLGHLLLSWCSIDGLEGPRSDLHVKGVVAKASGRLVRVALHEL